MSDPVEFMTRPMAEPNTVPCTSIGVPVTADVAVSMTVTVPLPPHGAYARVPAGFTVIIASSNEAANHLHSALTPRPICDPLNPNSARATAKLRHQKWRSLLG